VHEGLAVARSGQCGQAFVAVLALLAALSLAFVAVFDTGQLMVAKLRLASATDAAAYSTAVWDARTLNFSAAMNRAVIANEAALAQSVSLRSWSGYMNRTLSNIGALTRWLPYLNAATEVLRRFWQGFDRGLQPSLGAAEAIFSTAIPLLAGAQQIMLQSGELGAVSIMRETLAANDPLAEITAGGQLLLMRGVAQARGFTTEYSGARRSRQREVVLGSIDGFVRQRSVRLSPLLIAPLVRFEKRGGTELLGFEQWRAVDTLSLHARSGLLLGRWRERVPVGWGAAANGRPTSARGSLGASARVNPRATRLAMAGLRELRSYRGLADLRDLSSRALQEAAPRRWVIRTARRIDTLATARSALRITQLPAPVDRLFAMSAADVRFDRRVARGDRRAELGSLFNPYWRARLSAVTAGERLASAAADGVADPLDAVAP
jgi:Putative Flp pilus-assembly TadE/G-like